MGMFDTLLEADDGLVDWILSAHPTNDAEKARMRDVLAIRTQLDRAINELVAHRLELAAAALADDAKALDDATKKLAAVARTIATVEDVVRIGGTVLDITGKALAFVAG